MSLTYFLEVFKIDDELPIQNIPDKNLKRMTSILIFFILLLHFFFGILLNNNVLDLINT